MGPILQFLIVILWQSINDIRDVVIPSMVKSCWLFKVIGALDSNVVFKIAPDCIAGTMIAPATFDPVSINPVGPLLVPGCLPSFLQDTKRLVSNKIEQSKLINRAERKASV